MRRLRLLLLVLAGFLAVPAFSASEWAPPADLRLIVAIAPNSSLNDWRNQKSPAFSKLMREGALAVMNTRTARMLSGSVREPRSAAVLTLAAGSRCASPGDPIDFLPARTEFLPGTTAADVMQRRLLTSSDRNAAAAPAWSSILNANAAVGYDVSCGNLASSLSTAGIVVRSDGGRWSNLFAANDRGEATSEPMESLTPTGRWMWVGELGDKSREQDLSRWMTAARERHALLLVISPFASDADYKSEHRLTPIALWGDGVPHGLLYSSATRTAGLVANTDIAPTIASWFGVPLYGRVSGRSDALTVITSDNGPAHIANIERQAVKQRLAMQALPYFALALGAWFVLNVPFFRKWLSVRTRQVLVAIPMGSIPGILVSTSPTALAVALPAGIALSTLLALRIGSRSCALAASIAVLLVFILDTAAGNPLMKTGALGYSPIEGARYYGIGNEGMGVFLAAALIVVDWLWNSHIPKRRAVASVVIICATIILGKFGAKAGGIAVSIGMFAVYAYTAAGGRWNAARAALIPVAAVAGILLFALADMLTAHGSHLGVEMGRVAHSGLPEALSVMGRKLAVEVRLMWHSAWAVPLWLAVGLLACGNKAHGNALRAALIAGAGLTLALNDAGVVAAVLLLTMANAWKLSHKTAGVDEMTNGRPDILGPAV